MQYEVHYADVTENLQTLKQPVFMLERELIHGNDPKGGLFNAARVARRGSYYVPIGPLAIDTDGPPTKFAMTAKSDHVRIPISHYEIAGAPSLSSAVAIGLKLGIDLVAEAVRQVQTVSDKPVTRAVLVIGHECHAVTCGDGSPGMRCYVGLALAVDA